MRGQFRTIGREYVFGYSGAMARAYNCRAMFADHVWFASVSPSPRIGDDHGSLFPAPDAGDLIPRCPEFCLMIARHSPERATAEEKFAKKQRQAEEAAVAMSDHEKAMQHRIVNTERLRALRLDRDAELAKGREAPLEAPEKRSHKRKTPVGSNQGTGGLS